ncbi:DUF3140 domain-containing protein [Microtetraspora sp. AC03309]|uniref:DUF3140 domain-containing protein n=1 Tax=Microtetraspora sp. AC03309 TaxID=2779376 RepID=UPI001E36A0E9|nr:DUF3140 domain-containing protein [Microtetraspora sp. AC03309]MCC5576838.1 DUF3140 domain-containing protein [Microtetraspora sp. AC03309]
MTESSDPEVDLLWEEFHEVVNMTSAELRSWLLTSASGESAFPADPDLGVQELGRGVLHVLGKRKGDLTGEDLEVMRHVVDFVRGKMAGAPATAARNERWRHSLKSVGHDPLGPAPTEG